MKTITLKDRLYPFAEALQMLMDGKCIGICPDNGENMKYVELDQETNSCAFIRWNNGGSHAIRCNQFLGEWALVIVDHRELNKTQP